LQAITFLTGVKALLLVVAAFYAIALCTRPRSVKTDKRQTCAIEEHDEPVPLEEDAELALV
jgi:hypothetical protein